MSIEEEQLKKALEQAGIGRDGDRTSQVTALLHALKLRGFVYVNHKIPPPPPFPDGWNGVDPVDPQI